MTNQTDQTILSEDKLYNAFDRIVCGRPTCAGATAAHTGYTTGGVRVIPLTAEDAEQHRAEGFEPRCECGSVKATAETTSTDPLPGTIAWIAEQRDNSATWIAQWTGQEWTSRIYQTGARDGFTNDRVRIIQILQ